MCPWSLFRETSSYGHADSYEYQQSSTVLMTGAVENLHTQLQLFSFLTIHTFKLVSS